MAAFKLVVRKRVLHTRAVVVNPRLGGLAATGEEKHVRPHALRVEYACRKPQDRVEVVVRKEFLAHSLASSALEKHIVRENDRRPAADLQEKHDVLKEV